MDNRTLYYCYRLHNRYGTIGIYYSQKDSVVALWQRVEIKHLGCSDFDHGRLSLWL